MIAAAITWPNQRKGTPPAAPSDFFKRLKAPGVIRRNDRNLAGEWRAMLGGLGGKETER